MRAKLAGNKRDTFFVVVQNKEATATLQIGQPVFYNLTGTASADGDGVGVVNPSTALVASYQLCAGVLGNQLATGEFGYSLVYGYSPSTLVKLASRATSTDSWSSYAAVASGVLLLPDFTNNVWISAANVAAQSSPQNLLLDAIASAATAASNAGGTGDTRVVSSGLKRSFVRMM